MSNTVSIRDGQGACPEKGLSNIAISFINSTGGVVGTGDYLIQAQSSPNNTVKAAVGKSYIPNSLGTMMYSTMMDSVISTTISPNSSGYARIDTIVLYIDLAVSPNATASNVAKFYDVTGTPAGSPSAPDSAAILAAIGASNPYIILGNVAVANGFTSINSGNITDMRSFASFSTGVTVPVNTYAQFTQQASTPVTPSSGFDKLYFKTDENPYLLNTSGQEIAISTSVKKIASYSPTVAGTTTLNLSTGNIQIVTMPATTQTLAISNGIIGQVFLISINNVTSQGALTWFSTIRWAAGLTPTLTGTNGKRDTFGFMVTGANTYDGYIVGQNL